MAQVAVTGVPDWVPVDRLLGPADWRREGTRRVAELARDAADDVAARLRGVGLGGAPIAVEIVPRPDRKRVRDARLRDSRARRDTTPGFTRPGTRLDDEGRVSLTPEALALALGRRAGPRRVLDATAGCGGNSIGFARAGASVLAIDLDPGRLALARHNARVYGVEDRIRFVAGPAEEQIAASDAELCFIDPPWGVDWDRGRVTLADLPLLQALLAQPRPETWVKVPPSFDPSTVPDAEPEAWFGEAPGDRHRVKFVILRLPASR